MLFMHSHVKRPVQLKYFSLGKSVVNTKMSGSEMIANILLTFMPAGVQVAFAFLKVDETAAVDFMRSLLQNSEENVDLFFLFHFIFSGSFKLLNMI